MAIVKAEAQQKQQMIGESSSAQDKDFFLKRSISILQGCLEEGSITQCNQRRLYQMLLSFTNC